MENVNEFEPQQKSFDWVKKCIESSNSPFHIEGCKKLVELFVERFGKGEQEGELLGMLIKKGDEINYI